jgi:sec-independent protein translocase protein TatC
MIVAPFLKLRDKLTRKRQALTEDEEKPFLEHLEDLRKTLTKVVLTLTVAIVACFVFNNYFFQLMYHPLDAAGLRSPQERNLPKAVADLDVSAPEKQVTWWRIHGAARGMADLDGSQREVFLKAAAPDEFTRQFAHAMLLYHAADALPEEKREAFIKEGAALVPGESAAKIAEYAAQLAAAKTETSLEPPANMVETEAFAPAETFMLSMKLSLFAGIIVSFPLLFYFLLEFILPGLTPRERKMIFPALGIGFALFLVGVAFAFFFVIPRALEFFHEYGAELGIKDRWRIGQYISFVTSFCLIFGVAFELPVVVMVMVKLGLLGCRTMREKRMWAWIIILIASAVLTPTGDAFTMSLLAAPMIIMYEACIWLAWLHERKERRLEEEERLRDEARRAALVGVASVQAARSQEQLEETPAAEETPVAESPPEDSPPREQDAHPHHPEETGEDDYEKYLRDSAGMSRQETHTESVPVEQREETPPAGETPPDGHTPHTRD